MKRYAAPLLTACAVYAVIAAEGGHNAINGAGSTSTALTEHSTTDTCAPTTSVSRVVHTTPNCMGQAKAERRAGANSAVGSQVDLKPDVQRRVPRAQAQSDPVLTKAPAGGLSSLPFEAQASVSAVLGRDDASYHAVARETGLRAQNPRHALTADFNADGVEVRTATARWTMALRDYGYGDALRPLSRSSGPQATANRIEYRHDGLTEWYVNGPAGLEQGFTLEGPPSPRSDGPLTLSFGLSGNLTASLTGGDVLNLSDPDGGLTLRYAGLVAHDADRRKLPAWLELEGSRLNMHVDGTGARYPVTIDPIFTSEKKLTASDSASAAGVGRSVAFLGDTALVAGGGAAYVFERHQGGFDHWGEAKKITPSDPSPNGFGFSVALRGDVSANGPVAQTALVGAPLDDSLGLPDAGAAYVFQRNLGGPNNWGQEQKLTASNPGEGDQFGYSVAVSGNTALIGAPYTEYNFYSVPFFDAGSAYFFERDVVGPDPWHEVLWTSSGLEPQTCRGDNFGFSVALDEDWHTGLAFAIIGRPGNPAGPAICGALLGRRIGAADIYERDLMGSWSFRKRLTTESLDNPLEDGFSHSPSFGSSVAIDGEYFLAGQHVYALVGAPYKVIDPFGTTGAAYLFDRDEGGTDGWGPVERLVASDRHDLARFGWSVAIRKGGTDEDNIALVGAPSASSDGAAYVFKSDPLLQSWPELQRLVASDASLHVTQQQFGTSVSIAQGQFTYIPGTLVIDPLMALVGAPGDFHLGLLRQTGAAYLYGDARARDFDGDGEPAADDNCPDDPNPLQADADFDNVGDVCDPCPADPADACAAAAGAELGSAGGTLTLPGARLIVPPGCLPAGTTLFLQNAGVITSGGLAGVSGATAVTNTHQIGPAGTTFSCPATLCLDITTPGPADCFSVQRAYDIGKDADHDGTYEVVLPGETCTPINPPLEFELCAQLSSLSDFTAFMVGALGGGQTVIDTYAGGGPDGVPATSANVNGPAGIAVDATGNTFVAVRDDHSVFKVDPSGQLTVVAGVHVPGFGGDGGPATSAFLNRPTGVALDAAGNLYIADRDNHRIRRVDALTGIITTVAGTGVAGFADGPAGTAQLNSPRSVAVAGADLFIADTNNHRIRKVSSGNVSTVAGTGVAGFSDGPAATAQLNSPNGVAAAGTDLYVADTNNHRIRMLSSGNVSTVAGAGVAGFLDGPVATARFSSPTGVAMSGTDLYVADMNNHRIRKVASGAVTTVAGTFFPGFGGDGGSATTAALRNPSGVAVTGTDLYIADTNNLRVRKVTGGIIETTAGNGFFGFSGDGGSATRASLWVPAGVVVDASGNVFISDQQNHRIRKVDPFGVITTVAGTGVAGFLGDGSPATGARLNFPAGLALDGSGNLYIADRSNHRIRRVDRMTGFITTVAGTTSGGFSGDGPATSSRLNSPNGVAVDGAGSLYIADSSNHRIRKVTAGMMSTVAGTTTSGYNGDGISATIARLNLPFGVAVDAAGNLYIADSSNHRVRKVTAGIISTVAGTGTGAFNGDGPAATTQVNFPAGLTLDAGGDLLIADQNNNRIRKLASGAITTVAGTDFGFFGDGGLPTAARLAFPRAVAAGGASTLFIADLSNNRIRRVGAVAHVECAAGGPYTRESCDGPADTPLNGTASCPDGSTPTLSWTSPDAVTFSDPGAEDPVTGTATFGTYALNLQVTCPGASPATCGTSLYVFQQSVGCNQPPVAICTNPTASADASCRAAASVDGGSFDPDNDTITLTQDPAEPYALGTTSVGLTVDDGQETTSCNATVTVLDDMHPTLAVPSNLSAECTSPGGTTVSYTPPTAMDNCSVSGVRCTPNSGAVFPIGATPVTCDATDGSGNTSAGGFTVTVVDTTPPTIAISPPAATECTGPTGAAVSFAVSADDLCSTATYGCEAGSVSVSPGTVFPIGDTTVSCIATDGTGNPATAPSFGVRVVDTVRPSLFVPADITQECTSPAGAAVSFVVTADDLCSAASVVCGASSGSVFPVGGPTVVSCTATDASGNATSGSFNVTITSTSPSITTNLSGSPLVAMVGTPVAFSMEFSDNPGDLHTAEWDFGDGSVVPVASAASPLGTSHVYGTPGVYIAKVTITDRCGNRISDSIVVVVFDPADGFTTGGGWFVPDPASFINGIPVTDPISKANFGFIVKYVHGQSNPNGNLEFQYKAGSINLKSTSIDWMVISATKVRFKGLATINGTGQYTFKVTADDNGEPGTNDTFKIEIWQGGNVDTENTLETPKHKAQGNLGGGNIQIHH